jgi:predicted CoA-binding protein
MTTRIVIDEFLRQKRIAVVGVSRNPKDFSRALFREFVKRGYDVVPVNPNVAAIEGRTCYRRLQEITPPVDGALLMTSAQQCEAVVRDCAEAGISRVWMYRGAGPGAVSYEAVAFCDAHGIGVVPGHCPYMFWPDVPFFHRLHGFMAKLTGAYPR